MTIIQHDKTNQTTTNPPAREAALAEQAREQAREQSDLIAALPQARSIVRELAERYGMEQVPFQKMVMDICFPVNPNKPNERPVSVTEFAAFLLICRQHRLNPIAREVFGFRSKSGAIIPIVSIDGWARIINEHPQMDGVEFDDHFDGANLTAITGRIWRKDRSRPTEITEYMAECRRDTDVWQKWPRRMLRHKALIQTARVAFGFSGIYDQDEAERIDDAEGRRMIAGDQMPRAGETRVIEARKGPPLPPTAAVAAAASQPQTPEPATPAETTTEPGPEGGAANADDSSEGGADPGATEDAQHGAGDITLEVLNAIDTQQAPPATESSAAAAIEPARPAGPPTPPPVGDKVLNTPRAKRQRAAVAGLTEAEQDWLNELESAYAACADIPALTEAQRAKYLPAQTAVSKAADDRAKAMLLSHITRVTK